MDYQMKKLIREMVSEIKKIYDFSLYPLSEKYQEPNVIAEKMGGGVEYDNVYEGQVCRCGNGFLIKLPSEKDKTRELREFAFCLAILFLEMKFQIDHSEFLENKNLEWIRIPSSHSSWENCTEFVDEMLCPADEMRKIVKEHCDENNMFDLVLVAKKLGLSVGYVEKRLVGLEMIDHWTRR